MNLFYFLSQMNQFYNQGVKLPSTLPSLAEFPWHSSFIFQQSFYETG
jgi:hypothetical protein